MRTGRVERRATTTATTADDEVELLLDRQAPEVQHRRRSGEQLGVGRSRRRGSASWRRRGAAAMTSPPDVPDSVSVTRRPTDEHGEHRQRGRQQPTGAPAPRTGGGRSGRSSRARASISVPISTPDRVKNSDTPRNPPPTAPMPRWNSTTTPTASPRRPSRPGWWVIDAPVPSGPGTTQSLERRRRSSNRWQSATRCGERSGGPDDDVALAVDADRSGRCRSAAARSVGDVGAGVAEQADGGVGVDLGLQQGRVGDAVGRVAVGVVWR